MMEDNIGEVPRLKTMFDGNLLDWRKTKVLGMGGNPVLELTMIFAFASKAVLSPAPNALLSGL